MIQFQGKTDKINPGFCWPDVVLNSALPWENISCFFFINIYVIPSGKHVFFRKLSTLLPNTNLTVCLHMRDCGHLPGLGFLHSYLRHFCLLKLSCTPSRDHIMPCVVVLSLWISNILSANSRIGILGWRKESQMWCSAWNHISVLPSCGLPVLLWGCSLKKLMQAIKQGIAWLMEVFIFRNRPKHIYMNWNRTGMQSFASAF